MEVNNSSAILKSYATGATLTELKDHFGIRGNNLLVSAVLDAIIHSGKMPKPARWSAGRQHFPSQPTQTSAIPRNRPRNPAQRQLRLMPRKLAGTAKYCITSCNCL